MSELVKALLVFTTALAPILLPLFISPELARVKVEGAKKVIVEVWDDPGSIFKTCTANPWAKTCSVRKAYPDVLIFKVKEKRPIAVVQDGKKKFLISYNGKPFLEVKKISEIPLVPFLEKNCLPDALETIKTLKKLNLKLSQVVCSNEEMEIFLSKTGTKLIAPKNYKFSETLPPILEKFNIREIKYIDFRFSTGIYIAKHNLPK